MAEPIDPYFYYTEAGLKTITAAIMLGTLEVYYGDKRVTYRSLVEMIQIRNMILSALGYGQPQAGRMYAEFNSGIHEERSFGCFGGNEGWGPWS